MIFFEREEEVQKRKGEKHSHGRSLPKEQHKDPAEILIHVLLCDLAWVMTKENKK
jgi:hypothetical protein